MPRVISDELYEDLISNIHEGRLLGVMGKLERLRDEAYKVSDGSYEYSYERGERFVYVEKEDETKTNNN